MEIQGHVLVGEPEARDSYMRHCECQPKYRICHVSYRGFDTFILLDGHSGPITSETYHDGERVSVLDAIFRGPSNVAFENLYGLPDNAPKRERVRYVAESIAATEVALFGEGVESLSVSTHKTVANLMKEMGWEVVGNRGPSIDLEKNLKDVGIVLPRILFEDEPSA